MWRDMIILNLKDEISEDLSLRIMVLRIFKSKEFQNVNECILIDFKDIKFMSRAFTHEYLQQKTEQQCKVFEVNVPSNIKKMFEVVENTKIKPELAKNI